MNEILTSCVSDIVQSANVPFIHTIALSMLHELSCSHKEAINVNLQRLQCRQFTSSQTHFIFHYSSFGMV